MSVYSDLVNKEIIFKVNEKFYELVYDHPWLSKFFQHTDQEFITKQQTDFVTGALGGPKNYSGRLVKDAHTHILVTDELFELRKSLLVKAMEEVNAPQELREAWLKIDDAFKATILKKSVSDCEKRFFTDEILDFKKVG